MPTKKPRIAITLPQEDYEVIKSYSEALKQPMSRFIASLVSESIPSLERGLEIVKTAQDVKDTTIDAIEADLIALCDDAHSVIDAELSKTTDAIRTAAPDARKREQGAPERNCNGDRREHQYPLAINKGVRSDSKHTNGNAKQSNRPFLALIGGGSFSDKGVSNGNN